MFKNSKMYILIATIIILGGLYYYTLGFRLSKTYEGIEYRLGNDKYEEKIKIKVDGLYYRKIFEGDRFEGTIIINDEVLEVNLNFDRNNRGELEGYTFSTRYGATDHFNYGTIYKYGVFEKLTILKYEEGVDINSLQWSNDNGLMISVPAKNRDEAIKVYEIIKPNMPFAKITRHNRDNK